MALPKLILKNQFGELSNNYILAGSDQIDISFIVDSTNGNGLGIRSLKSASLFSSGGAAAVYMATSSTPAVGNPNPGAGLIYIQLGKAYAGYIGGHAGFVSPLSGSSILVTTGVTAGLAYVITSVGTTTAAQWQALGLPVGVTPNVGVSFIAPATATTSGTGTMQVPLATGSGIEIIDVIGDPNQTANVIPGALLVCRCLAATNSSTTTLVAAAPANNTVIGLRFIMSALAGT